MIQAAMDFPVHRNLKCNRLNNAEGRIPVRLSMSMSSGTLIALLMSPSFARY
jgi:hypothetical protein